MSAFSSFQGLAEQFARIQAVLPKAIHESAVEAAKLVEATAKAEIGEYQGAKGPYPGWAVLSYYTLWGWGPFKGKIELGYATETKNNPLLRTGELRRSIQSEVESAGAVTTAIIGSTDPVALWHEHGTSKMPPRPFMGPAMFVNIKPIGLILQKRIEVAFRSGR